MTLMSFRLYLHNANQSDNWGKVVKADVVNTGSVSNQKKLYIFHKRCHDSDNSIDLKSDHSLPVSCFKV